MTNKKIVEKATVIGERYFKETYGVKVKFVDSQVMAPYVGHRVVLYGYIVGTNEVKVTINIDYRNFEVTGAGIPVGLRKINDG